MMNRLRKTCQIKMMRKIEGQNNSNQPQLIVTMRNLTTKEGSTTKIETITLATTSSTATTSMMRRRNQHLSQSPHTMATRGIMLFILVSLLIIWKITLFICLGLYQKIDPKVREARRKKFFGRHRRKRDTDNHVLKRIMNFNSFIF